MTLKSNPGNFFEDFVVGDELVHATPRTVTEADAALYTGLTGSRFALYSADTFAQDIGLDGAPIDPLLAFHVVFGKTVPDISLNAVANLGYADGRFLAPVYPGDTLRAVSEVIGVKENSNGKTGVVYVRTHGYNQQDQEVLSYVRWVMVNKERHRRSPRPTPSCPTCPPPSIRATCRRRGYALEDYNFILAGSPFGFEDYEIGEKIDHVDGFTVEEAEHQIATRLYQNTAKVHFNQYAQRQTPRGRRLIYGGVAISLAALHRLQRPRQRGRDHRHQRGRPRQSAGSPATPCSPGRKCSTRSTSATASAPCACASSPRGTCPARNSPTRTRKANTSPR